MTGRNTRKIRKRLGATATLFLLAGASFLAAAPAGAIGLAGWGAGSADAVWGATSGIASLPGGEADADMSGAAEAAAQAAGSVEANPPDPQPHVDEAAGLAAEAAARAKAHASAAAAKKDALAGKGAASWRIVGGDGSYDVVLGGAYGAGLDGTLLASNSEEQRVRVDVRGHEQTANRASARAEGALNGLLGTLEQLYGQARASMYVGLDGAAQAVGSWSMDIAGLFNMRDSAKVVNTDHLHVGKQVDVAAPAMSFKRVDLPEISIPKATVDQGGSVAADAAATATGAVRAE